MMAVNLSGLNIQPVEIHDPLTKAGQAMQLKAMLEQSENRRLERGSLERGAADQQFLSDLIKQHTSPDGILNRNAVVADLAKAGRGSMVPGFSDNISKIEERDSQTRERDFALAAKRLDRIHGTISSLLSKGDALTHDDVIGSIVDLTTNNIMDRNQAASFIRNLPPDVGQLRQLLLTKGLEAVDTKERLKLILPDFKSIDQGGYNSLGTVNNLTGQFTETGRVPKTASPDTVMSSGVSERNNIRTNETSRANAGMVNARANTVVIPTATGFQVVDKSQFPMGGTVTSVPVIEPGTGNPALPKDNNAFKEAGRRSQLFGQITMARELLPKATASGTGAAMDAAGNLIGISSESADAAAQLDTIGAWMTSNVPRFEGPQSDSDRKYYQEMAAMVGDRTKPTSQRLASLDRLESLMKDAEKRGVIRFSDTQPKKPGIPPMPPKAGSSPATPPGARPPLSVFEKK